jgi:hemerythrin superfamily protein
VTDHSNDVDVVDALTTDHREAEELLGRARAATDPQERRDLADQLIAELVRHSVAEEMWVYPAMREALPDGDEAVEHDTKEHKELEVVMKQLEGADPAGEDFDLHLQRIEVLLRDHVTDEEQEQFPKLRQALPPERLVQLKGQVEAAKAIAPTRPHPLSPNSPLFHFTAGPGVGLVDRLRDKLTNRST